MNSSKRPIPIVAVIAIAAFGGALASTFVQRTAIAASAPAVQDPQLTALLKHVSIDAAGDVTITGGKISLRGASVDVRSGAATTIEGGTTTTIKSGGATFCCPMR